MAESVKINMRIGYMLVGNLPLSHLDMGTNLE